MIPADFYEMLAVFCFGYPFIVAWYWIAGGIVYSFMRERHEPRPGAPPPLHAYPAVSVLIPCFNEEGQIAETFAALAAIEYPDLEIIAIDDGSRDGTAAALDRLAQKMPRLRVIHLASNQGKSTALNVGALAARGDILVGIDGDALLDRHAVTWLVRRFQTDPGLGALTGNPRIRNRGSLLGRLQVGEFSSIIGLIKRTQTAYGSLFTVSGVVCAFRKKALHDADWWSPGTLTDDVDVSWRIQTAGWRIAYEPKAMCWILMPETLRGLWRQRLRWSEGGMRAVLDSLPRLPRREARRLIPVCINYLAATAWAYGVALLALWSGAGLLQLLPPHWLPAADAVPPAWGSLIALTYLLQALVAAALDERFEEGSVASLFWVVWYPLAFWALQAATAIVGLPKAVARPRAAAGTWVSPDRGFR
jgi:biofilm PGA synthesis N-glycosyltransferase PgaC